MGHFSPVNHVLYQTYLLRYLLLFTFIKNYAKLQKKLKILNKNPVLVDNMEETIIVHLKKGTLPKKTFMR